MGAAKTIELGSVEKENEANKASKPLAISRAIVFISRATVRSVLMRELKQYGIQDVKAMDTLEECLDDLKHNTDSLLVLDWEQGQQKVLKVLRAAQGKYRVDTRPIYFITLDMSEKTIAMVNEYNVTQVHTGEISQAQIVKNLNELMTFALVSPTCRKVFREVTELRKKGEWKASAARMKALCASEPDNLRAAIEYGYSLCEGGLLDEAEPWLQDLAGKHPNELRTKHLLARCAMKRGDFEAAQALLNEASVISPHNVDRLVDLGHILMGMDKVDEALGKFNEALKLDKDFQEAKVGKAQCDMLSGHVNEAMKLLGQMQSPQELASVFNGAAILAIRHNHFKQGLSLYKTAIGFLSQDKSVVARVFFNMGVGLVKWGKGAPALAAFEKAASLDPSFRKAKHNHHVLQVLIKKGGSLAVADTKMQELASLDQEVPDFSKVQIDLGNDAAGEGSTDGMLEEVDDSYFQSLLSGT